MKILQVNKYHYPRGGADRYYLDLGQRLEAEGHEVAYFAMQHPKNIESSWSKYFVSRVSYNEQVWRYAWKIPGRTLYSLETKRKFTRLLKDFRPDIIHIHNIYHQLSPSLLDVAAAFKIPVVMHLHDYKLVCPNHSLFTKGKVCQECLHGSYWPCIKRRCVKDSIFASLLAATEMYLHHHILKIYEKKVSLFISPSNFLKEILVTAGWPEEKIMVINNAFRADLPLPLNDDRQDYFLYYGRLSQEKGIDLAIKAVIEDKRLHLKVVGSGPEDDFLQTLGAETTREGRIEFLGWQEGRALSTLIAQAQAVIIPSRWLENFPLNALEALSLGTPIIAANIGGLPEIIDDSNGILVPAEDSEALKKAMLKILSQEKIWQRTELQATARRFTPEKNSQGILAVYQKLLAK